MVSFIGGGNRSARRNQCKYSPIPRNISFSNNSYIYIYIFAIYFLLFYSCDFDILILEFFPQCGIFCFVFHFIIFSTIKNKLKILVRLILNVIKIYTFIINSGYCVMIYQIYVKSIPKIYTKHRILHRQRYHQYRMYFTVIMWNF